MAFNLQKSLKSNNMKKFNQTITIEIEVDNIANQLLEKMNPEFKHREPVVEAIIGTALNSRDNTLSHIFNALSGHLPEINYKVGDIVDCTSETYMYLTEESRQSGDSQRAKLGKSKVIEINPFSSTPLLVEYDYYRKDGTVKKDTSWVKMSQCSEFPSVQHEDIFS